MKIVTVLRSLKSGGAERYGQQVEHEAGVPHDAGRVPRPVLAAHDGLEARDLVPVLDVDGEGVANGVGHGDSPGAKVNTGWQFRVPLYALFGTGYLGYTAARQMFERIISLWMLWMYNRIGIGKGFLHGMVVCHNNIDTHLLGIGNRFMTRYAIVHRHNKRNPLLLDKILVN